MHFDLADLRLFIHIAESPSIRQGAAPASHRRRPARGSRRWKADSRLLYRDSRGVELTPAGQKLLQHARLIMRQASTRSRQGGRDHQHHSLTSARHADRPGAGGRGVLGAGTALQVGQLDGHRKRLDATVVAFPHYDPTKARVRA